MGDTNREIEAEIPRLRRYARALTRDVVTADDLVQDCLTRALGKLHLWHDGTDLRAWLFTILHNQYVNQIRRSVTGIPDFDCPIDEGSCDSRPLRVGRPGNADDRLGVSEINARAVLIGTRHCR